MEFVELIRLSQYTDQCQALVNTVMNLLVPQNTESFCVAEQLLVSQEGLS
jgi:hypothetical protein